MIEASVYPQSEQSQQTKKSLQAIFGEPWTENAKTIREHSRYKGFESYRLRPFIIKGGDDLR